MKNIFLLSLIIISGLTGQSQTIRFNRTYEKQDTAIGSSTIIETDTGYVIKGFMGYPENKITFFYFDWYGNMTEFRNLGNPNYVYSYGGNLKKDLSGNYITASGKKNYYGEGTTCIFKFNSHLDLLWEKSFFPVDSFNDHILNCGVDKNNNYIITGASTYQDNGNISNSGTNWSWYHPFILKVDSNGNFIYHKQIAPLIGTIFNFSCDQNNHYWLAGNYNNAIGLYDVVPTVFECDSNGQILWSKNFGSYFLNSHHELRSHYSSLDSSVLLYGFIQTRHETTGPYMESYMVKIKNHQIDWDLYGAEDSSLSSSITTITELSDHSLILAGNNDLTLKPYAVPYDSCPFVDSTGISDQILKLTPDGNCMWRRQIYVPNLITDSIYHPPSIQHLIQTKDGGFAFTGIYAWKDPNFILHFPIWFVKTDSLGCDGVGSCSDTAIVLNLLSVPDTICASDTTWLTFEINGLSAPFTLSSSDGNQISGIYFIKDPYTVFATDSSFNISQPQFWFDTSRVVPNHLYQQFPIVANTTDSIYSVNITLRGYYGRTLSHTYTFPVKDCHTGINSLSYNSGFSVYPNPSTGNFTVSFPENSQVTYLTIANTTGQVIRIIPINKGQTIYHFTNKLPHGTYFVGVDNGNKTLVKKLIVN